MSSIKKISIVALALLIIGVIGSFVTFNTTSKPVTVSEERVIDDDITDIEISADNQKVELISANEDKPRVELSGRSTEDVKNQLSVNVDGNTLSINLVEKRLQFFDFFNFIGTSLTLEVHLPEKVYESLQVDIDNGEFQAEQLKIREVKAGVSNGLIEMKNITAAMVSTEADNGQISLENVEGKIYGKVNNGKIYLGTKTLDRPITLESNNGKIKIETEKEPTNTTFDIEIDNGKATVFGSSNWNTVVGDGENLIKLKTNNGHISVEK
ncbi:DUF4097 family beta strand repeat-containing protein [Virgibacillus doumboii]|uniref:DUF4097 family beta strand repeat-containing protein n=1 Tax=Virgibacillus doumboii TaxID=2697503 RepID=UPI0013E001EA|nr:DUF4097 family beta strand repeat-containing protein [Virgibacillus doumboii]